MSELNFLSLGDQKYNPNGTWLLCLFLGILHLHLHLWVSATSMETPRHHICIYHVILISLGQELHLHLPLQCTSEFATRENLACLPSFVLGWYHDLGDKVVDSIGFHAFLEALAPQAGRRFFFPHKPKAHLLQSCDYMQHCAWGA